MSSSNCSPRSRNARLGDPSHQHLAPTPVSPTNGPSRSCPAPHLTPNSIGPHVPWQGKKSPCPALNALCNHGAYGMPRDGKDVHASVLARALIEVYGLKTYFAYMLAYGAILGITKGKSLTLDLDKLCAAPIAHFAPLVHVNPTRGLNKCTHSLNQTEQVGQTDGEPSRFLVNKMLSCASPHDPNNFTLENFALHRNRREQEVAGLMSAAQRYIAAGELALLLQVFGDRHNDYSIPCSTLYDFFAHERLPDDWLPSRIRPVRQIGFGTTFHVGHHVRRSMAKVRCRMYIPYYVWAMVLLSAIAGVVVIRRAVL